jgi:outer membrane protein assembly factor BamB
MFGLSLGGTQQWARAIGGSDDIFMQRQRQPAIGADGSLYLSAMGGANGWGLRRVDPNSGNVLWNYSPWPSNGMSPPSVGPDGTVYALRSSVDAPPAPVRVLLLLFQSQSQPFPPDTVPSTIAMGMTVKIRKAVVSRSSGRSG